MIERVFGGVHEHWYYRILFVPLAILSSLLLVMKLIEWTFLLGITSAMVGFVFSGADLTKLTFTAERSFYIWFEVTLLCYAILLVYRSLRVVLGKPFYLLKGDVKIFFRYDRLALFTTIYMCILSIMYVALPLK